MPRHAQLKKKDGYWITKAGAPNGKYFGRVDEISAADAKVLFVDYLKTIVTPGRSRAGITVGQLVLLFLDAVKAHRGERTYDERQYHLDRFLIFARGKSKVGDLPATIIHADDLTAFLEYAKKEYKFDAFTAHKHMISIVAAFNWGSGVGKLKNPKPCLSAGFRPFANIERYKAAPKELLETDLPTPDEIKALLAHADDDLELMYENGRYRTRRPDEYRQGGTNPYRGFADMLIVYHAAGPRTGELARARVKNYARSTRQIVLAEHKRSKTMKQAATRRIMLNDLARVIVEKLCKGKGPDDPIFTDPKGRAWTWRRLDHRFQQVRGRAKVREEITLYSFRHLWISEMLMHGNDIATVARMAGTSVAMIETVYGHFKGDHFAEALKKLDAARGAA